MPLSKIRTWIRENWYEFFDLFVVSASSFFIIFKNPTIKGKIMRKGPFWIRNSFIGILNWKENLSLETLNLCPQPVCFSLPFLPVEYLDLPSIKQIVNHFALFLQSEFLIVNSKPSTSVWDLTEKYFASLPLKNWHSTKRGEWIQQIKWETSAWKEANLIIDSNVFIKVKNPHLTTLLGVFGLSMHSQKVQPSFPSSSSSSRASPHRNPKESIWVTYVSTQPIEGNKVPSTTLPINNDLSSFLDQSNISQSLSGNNAPVKNDLSHF